MCDSDNHTSLDNGEDGLTGLIYTHCSWAEPNLSWDASKQIFATGNVGHQPMVRLWSCNLYYEDKYYEEDMSDSPAVNFRGIGEKGGFADAYSERNIAHIGSLSTNETVGIAWISGDSCIVSVDVDGDIRLMCPSEDGLMLRSETKSMRVDGTRNSATAMALSPGQNQVLAISMCWAVHRRERCKSLDTP